MSCRGCFLDQFEKRVKKALKERELLKGQRVLVVGELAGYLVKKFVHVPLELEFVSAAKDGDYDAVIVEWTMDDECVGFLKAFGSDLVFERNEKIIKALRFVSDEDALLYAQMKSVRFAPREKDKNWQGFLQVFADHPEMKNNLLRNADEIKRLIVK